MLNFNEKLRKFRDSRGFTRANLAAEIGVSASTVYRWETDKSRPSPLAVQKLAAIGLDVEELPETYMSSVPRIKAHSKPAQIIALAKTLKTHGAMYIGKKQKRLTVLPSPFVRNGPPDQTAFHKRLLHLQMESPIDPVTLSSRLSMVEDVVGVGQPTQHLLEMPKPVSVSWNSNYGSHGWHRYIGRFPPHVVRALLNYFGATSNSVVCDPFVGSGTTAVECRLLGIPFVGIEICPLSVMLTRTKAAFPANSDSLFNLAKRYVEFYDDSWSKFVGFGDISKIKHQKILEREGNTIPPFSNVEHWFTNEALLGTSITVQYGMGQMGFEREAVLTALSAKMRSIGNVDVDVVRAEYRKTPRLNVNVRNLVSRQLTRMAKDIDIAHSTHARTIGDPTSVKVCEGSVLDIDLERDSVDHIITSPPYGVEAISYLRTHLLSYRSLVSYLKHDPYQTRAQTIGSEYLVQVANDAGRTARDNSQVFKAFFEKKEDAGDSRYDQRRTAMMQFCDDMFTVGSKMARWLKTNGRIAFILGNKRLGADVIPMDSIVVELFEKVGLNLENTIRHKLKTNNSNSQVPWQERTIQEESILVFRKVR